MRRLSRKWQQATTRLVEDKANGSAVIQTLRHEIGGLVAINPNGGKMARAQAVAAVVEPGNVYLPHPRSAAWVEAFMDECAGFPTAKNDDQVDAMTQALLRLMLTNGGPRKAWIA